MSATRETRWAVPPHVLLGVASAVAMWLWIAVESREMLAADVAVWGDSAANAILVDRALSGRQLVGYYSRFAFSHPGPAFIYVEAAGELLFRRWLPVSNSSFGASALGVAALNSGLVGWCAAIVAKRARSVAPGVVLVLCTIMVTGWIPGQYANAWAPSLVLVPFILLMVAATSVAAGHYGELLALAVAAGLLLHGHISMVPFVALAFLVVGVMTLRRRRDDSAFQWPTRRAWVPAVVAVLLFAAPILIHTLADWPGEFGKYLSTGRGSVGDANPSLGETVRFWYDSLVHGWVQLGLLLTAIAIIGAVGWKARWCREARAAVWILLGQSVLLLFYSWRVVDDLEHVYLGWFASAVPIVTVTLATSVGLDEIHRRMGDAWKNALAGLIIAGLVIAVGLTAHVGQGTPSSTVVAELAEVARQHPIRLTFEHEDWPIAVGVLVESNRSGGTVCLVDPTWEFMVTSDMICADPGEGDLLGITSNPSEQDLSRALASSGGYVLVER